MGRLIIREFKHLCLRITVSAIQKRNMEDSVKFVNEAEKNRRSSYRVIRMITWRVNYILRDNSFVLHNKDSLDHVI